MTESKPPTSDIARVSEASYPIPAPLSFILRCCINETPDSSELNIERESPESGLEELLANAFCALDSLYFSTPSNIRNLECFSHRQCIRIETNTPHKGRPSLTITDYGSGMTRADLINCLGVGSTLSPLALSCVGRKKANSDPLVVPCQTGDLGGFYAALCSLGVGAEVGTKSAFDDYYLFSVGRRDEIDETCSFEEFKITRPMNEGELPWFESGFKRFSDVRGSSGTRVTVFLNDEAIKAGYADEDVLRKIVVKMLERSQYRVAFSSDNPEQVRALVEASKKEHDDVGSSTSDDGLADDMSGKDSVAGSSDLSGKDSGYASTPRTVRERAVHIPIRLSLGERKMLRLVESAMSCSDYTSAVDSASIKSKAKRTHIQLKHICSILRGMVTACDYQAGQTLINDNNYTEYEQFFRQMFEIGRRHKIMNPEKMRENYGKLIFLLQDAVSPTVLPHLGFNCKQPIQTVYSFLRERDGLALLDDKLIELATMEVLAENKSRAKIQQEIKRKEKAVAALKQNYRSATLSSEDIHLCLYSICDNNSFLNSNRLPIDKIISYLQKFFHPSKIEDNYSLAIISGKNGARLSHSHERQYYFALQSLTLWRDIIDDMFRLWQMAEEDLLSETITYNLKNTGQGFMRVQQSPRTYKAMQCILRKVQMKVSHWIGSSVVHLGDHNVPNALSFIDKYTQVPRILGPIVVCLDNIEALVKENDGIQQYVHNAFGGVEALKKDILYDFFKSAFDGSGADNFYDAGSCIDGRLTSAWNWCSQLHGKKYWPIFKLTGFTGFDGEFK